MIWGRSKVSTGESRAQVVAESIARMLFANSLGERADRLAQLRGGFPIGGGWSFSGATDAIREVLEDEGYILDRMADADRRAKEVR